MPDVPGCCCPAPPQHRISHQAAAIFRPRAIQKALHCIHPAQSFSRPPLRSNSPLLKQPVSRPRPGQGGKTMTVMRPARTALHRREMHHWLPWIQTRVEQMSSTNRQLRSPKKHSAVAMLHLMQQRVEQRKQSQPGRLICQAAGQGLIQHLSPGCCWQYMRQEGEWWMYGKLCMGPGCAASGRGLTVAC